MKNLGLLLLLFAVSVAWSLDRQPNADYRARREVLSKKASGAAVLMFAPTEAEGPNAVYGFRQDQLRRRPAAHRRRGRACHGGKVIGVLCGDSAPLLGRFDILAYRADDLVVHHPGPRSAHGGVRSDRSDPAHTAPFEI
jgi:hypothetical protein